MDAVKAIKAERVIDVREISARVRHTMILQLFEHLDDMSSLQLMSSIMTRGPCASNSGQTRQSLPVDLSRTRAPNSGASGCNTVAAK